jgi:hypothetical protein
MKYGYARISMVDQNPDTQLKALQRAGVEKESGQRKKDEKNPHYGGARRSRVRYAAPQTGAPWTGCAPFRAERSRDVVKIQH